MFELCSLTTAQKCVVDTQLCTSSYSYVYQHVEADVYQRVEADDRNSDDYYTVYLTVKRFLVQQLLFFPRCSSYASGSTHVLASL